jgi:hypothetical protein
MVVEIGKLETGAAEGKEWVRVGAGKAEEDEGEGKGDWGVCEEARKVPNSWRPTGFLDGDPQMRCKQWWGDWWNGSVDSH